MFLLLFSQYPIFFLPCTLFFRFFVALVCCVIGSHLKFALLVASFHQKLMEMWRLAYNFGSAIAFGYPRGAIGVSSWCSSSEKRKPFRRSPLYLYLQKVRAWDMNFKQAVALRDVSSWDVYCMDKFLQQVNRLAIGYTNAAKLILANLQKVHSRACI